MPLAGRVGKFTQGLLCSSDTYSRSPPLRPPLPSTPSNPNDAHRSLRRHARAAALTGDIHYADEGMTEWSHSRNKAATRR